MVVMVCVFVFIISSLAQKPPYTCPSYAQLDVLRHKSQLDSQDCTALTSELILKNEGCLNCVYYDSDRNPTIGIGYCIAAGCKNPVDEDFASLNPPADTKAIFNAHPLEPGSSNRECKCTGFECLTESQVQQLFTITLNRAASIAAPYIKSSPSMCCNATAVVVDIAFNEGPNKLPENFPQFLDYIMAYYWSGAAEILMQCHVKYFCKFEHGKPNNRCANDYALLTQGCSCQFGGCPFVSNNQCSGGYANYGICQQASTDKGTCCKLKATCKDPKAENSFTYSGKCVGCGYTCCESPLGYGCCSPGYSNCCQNIRACCETGYPVCCTNYCCPSGASCTTRGCSFASGEIVVAGKMVYHE